MIPRRIVRGGSRSPRRPPLLLLAALVLASGAAWFAFRVSPEGEDAISTQPVPARPSGPASVALAFSFPASPTLSPEASEAARRATEAETLTLDALRRRAELDPENTARWLAAGSAPPGDSWPWFEQLALAWAGRDPDAALAWARGQGAPALRSALLLAVAGELARARPLDAVRAALDASAVSSPERDAVLRRAAAEWAIHDADAAVRWAWSVADAPLRVDLLSGVILAVAETDPATAWMMAEDDLPAGRIRDDAAASILQRWAQHDADAARARWATLPDGALKTAAAPALAAE